MDDDEQRRQLMGYIPPFKATGAAAGLALPAVNTGVTLGQQKPATAGTKPAQAGSLSQQAKAVRDAQNEPPSEDATKPISMPEAKIAFPSSSDSSLRIAAPRGTLEGDVAYRGEKLKEGPLDSQIYKRVTGSNFGQNHPVLGKILGGLGQGIATLGDTALSTVAPALAVNLPGTRFNFAAHMHGLNQQIAEEQSERQKEATTQAERDRSALETAQTAAIPETQKRQMQQIQAGLAEHGLQMDDQGQISAVPEEQLSPEIKAKLQGEWKPVPGVAGPNGEPMEYNANAGTYRIAPGSEGASVVSTDKTTGGVKGELQQQIQQAYNKGDAATVTRLQNELRAIDPQAADRLAITIRGQNLSEDRSERTATRQDIRDHDKAYVQPAEGVEKSYEMMDQAYNEYEAARKQGKQLPTGAQSMLALSTHLSTTFGNVKGARVTRDMIAHHLGARSVSDDALVAVQKITNGDVLSPAQWTAFHDLIKQSRNLSWSTAVKEAARKHIPIDFLPPDLQKITKGGIQYEIGDDGQYHKAGE